MVDNLAAPVDERPDRLPARFQRLFAATAISAVGTGMTLTVIPMLVVSSSLDPGALGVVAGAGALPGALLALPSGALADRLERRRLLIVADLARAVVLAIATVLVVTEAISVWALVLVALLIGAGDAVFVGSAQALVPHIVADQDLERANGRLSAVTDIGVEFAGPPLGSFTFAIARWVPFAADAVSYLVSAIVLRSIADEESAAPADAATVDDAPVTGFGPAVRLFRANLLLRTLLWSVFVLALCSSAVITLLILVVKDRLSVAPRYFGLFLAVGAIAGPLAGTAMGALGRRLSPINLFIVAIAVNAATYIALGLVTWWPAGVLVLFCWVFTATVRNVMAISIPQRLVPDELRGRALSFFRLFLHGGAVVGALLVAATASWLSVPATLIMSGVVQCGVVCWWLVRRTVLQAATAA